MKGIFRGLTENTAHTDPTAAERRLRGRTYAIPFDAVWNAALALAQGGLRGWTLISSDDEDGNIRAESRTLVMRFIDDVEVSIGLDENGQTRVDATSASRTGSGDLGRNARTLGGFFRRLDRALGATAEQVLDPTQTMSWTENA